MKRAGQRLSNRVAAASAWSFASTILQQAAGFVVFAILANVLGVEAYGIVSIALIVVSLSEFLVGPSATDAIVHRTNLEPGHIEAVLTLQLGFGVIVALLITLLADPIAQAFGEPQIGEFLPWLGLAIVLASCSSAPMGVLQRELQFGLLAARSTLGFLAGSAVALWMAFHGFGPWALIGQQLARFTIDVVIVYTFGTWRPGFKVRLRHFRDVIGMSLRISSVTAVTLLGINLPRIVLGATLGPAAVSYWNVGWRLHETLGTVFLMPLVSVWFPLFARVQTQRENLREAVRFGVVGGSLIGSPVFAGLAAVSPVFVPIVFGQEWAEGVPTLKWLCLYGVMWSVTIMKNALLRGVGRHNVVLAQTLLLTFARAVLILMIGRAGPTEAAIAYTLPTVAVIYFTFCAFKDYADVKIAHTASFCMPAVICSIILYVSTSLFMSALQRREFSDLEILLIAVPFGVAVYAVSLFVFARKPVFEFIIRGRGILRSGSV